MNILTVKNLVKKYEKFELKNVSFSVEEGTIIGFIGRNGAGKTTTLKSILGLLHPDQGEIKIFQKNFAEHELEIKKEIGFVSGGISFYPKKSLKALTNVTKRFYENWDETVYRKYLEIFRLDETKKAEQLSEGMKVKYLLAVAMSHHARFLILDEPTSGLDPVSRDELLDIFLDIVEKEHVTLLYSTHVITDLEKCADGIIYIQNGEIKASSKINDFIGQYKLVTGPESSLSKFGKDKIIGLRVHGETFKGIVKTSEAVNVDSDVEITKPSLEEIMIYLEKDL